MGFLVLPSYISSDSLWAILLHAAVQCTNKPRNRPALYAYPQQVVPRRLARASVRARAGDSAVAPRRRLQNQPARDLAAASEFDDDDLTVAASPTPPHHVAAGPTAAIP